MKDFVWISENGKDQKIEDLHQKHLLNIVKKLYKEGSALKAKLRAEAVSFGSEYVNHKQLSLTESLTDQEFCHRVFPELDLLLREMWRRGMFGEVEE
jgi:hypothetical protein